MGSKTTDLRVRFNPEARFGGHSRHDAMIEFYTRISALVRPSDRVLDFGAGRGAQIAEDQLPYRKWLKTLRGRVAHVEGVDVDEAVQANPYLDSSRLFDPSEGLPYENEAFDLIYANWVFEHVEEPEAVARELLRVCKPGGYICAITPNRHGYIALASRLAGNKNHISFLRRVQPGRKEFDVFPTVYRLNTPAAARKAFSPAEEVVVYAVAGDPSYTFGSPTIYRLFQWLHRLTPQAFQPILLIFIQKNHSVGTELSSEARF